MTLGVNWCCCVSKCSRLSPKAGCGGIHRLAMKKSSYMTASSSLGSGTVSALGSRASPSAKYPFSTISLILPWVMVDAPKYYVQEFSSSEVPSSAELSVPPALNVGPSPSEAPGTSPPLIIQVIRAGLSTMSRFSASATLVTTIPLSGLQRTMTFG
jgi:hypothetical protein